MCELNLWGIETFLIVPKNEKNMSVNWTCEGLKLHFVIHYIIILNHVWIEPVRDWNNFAFHFNSPFFVVWIEPVRDWNFFYTKKPRQFIAQCELNLWGIETRKQKNLVLLLRSRVNWTCEGLKQFNPYMFGT